MSGVALVTISMLVRRLEQRSGWVAAAGWWLCLVAVLPSPKKELQRFLASPPTNKCWSSRTTNGWLKAYIWNKKI